MIRASLLAVGVVALVVAALSAGVQRFVLCGVGGVLVLFGLVPGLMRFALPFWFGYRATVKGTTRWVVKVCGFIREKHPNATMHEVFRLALKYRYIDFAARPEPELLHRAVELLEDPMPSSNRLESLVYLILIAEGELRWSCAATISPVHRRQLLLCNLSNELAVT